MATGQFDDGAYRIALAGVAATTGGALLSVANPEGRDIYVTRLIINVTTVSTGAAVVNAGIGSTATTDSDNLIDGKDVNGAAGAFDNFKDAGSNGKGGQKWASGAFLTLTGSATTVGLVGEVIVHYIPL